MSIRIGDTLPCATLHEIADGMPRSRTVEELTRGKRVIIVGLPGAFTPTCSGKHIPGFLEYYPKLKSKSVDEILCVSVNDAFVMDAWGKALDAQGKIRMLGDGNGDFAKALGFDIDLSAKGMGVRSRRYAMLVENSVVKALNLDDPGKFEVSDACTVFGQLD